MARGKKAAKELTPEEKLQQALVPVEEQPYPIPENWCWIKLSNVIELVSGRDVPLTDCNSEGIGIPYILGASNIENNTFTVERWIETPQIISNKGNILLSVKGTIGKLYIQQEEQINISRQIMAIQPLEVLNSKLVYLFLLLVCDELREAGNGLIPGISRADILDKAFPFVPFSEQTRIVSRIESLFAKLGEAKEKAQAVVDGFERRKSAILHKAFTGELTERWRKEYGVGMDSWKMVSFNDCIQKMQNGLAKRSGSIGESYVVLRLANLSEDGFDTNDLREILLDEKEQETYSLLENDVIMIRVNGSKDNVGRQLLVPDVKKWAFCDHIIRIRYQNNVLPNYMVLFSKSDNYRTYVKDHMVSSAGQNTISRKGMANMAVPIPECDEQREIVRTLSVLFSKEQQAKEAAEAVLSQIDTMKKAILARAFRGELGTNDPAEESAAELIKTVL